jgi:hypothetical protein
MSVAVVACGDDDDGSSATPSGSAAASEDESGTARPTTTDSEAGDDDDDGDLKTPGPSETEGGQTPVATAPGEVPTVPPPAAEGTPAPEVPPSVLADFQGKPITYSDCIYSLSTRLVDCGDQGLYAIDPPIVGQDITCQVWFVENVREIIGCTSVEPYDTKFYDIQE